MKLDLLTLGKQAIENTGTPLKEMKLSGNATSMVFQLFTKNVYSNPIGTIVREITSNCFDSHVEAGVDLPVVIKLIIEPETNSKYISFTDFGVGMSPDRVENIYGVYFESTKRLDNNQIGGFGIGGKTPLAYKRNTGAGESEYDNSFYIVTVFDNIKYYYLIFEGEMSPVISLLHSEPTDEKNGTEIRIPVLQKDITTFVSEMVRQLYYFENIIFEGFDDYENPNGLTNDYKIVRGDNFLFRGGYYSYMHICLGRVAYPIDYNILNLNSNDYQIPVALKLNVGDINVTVSRETIDYSETTIKMLKAKLIEAKNELTELLVKQYEDVRTIEQYFEVKQNFGYLKFQNGTSLYLGNAIKQSSVSFTNFAYNVLKLPNDNELFHLFFSVKTYGKKTTSKIGKKDDKAFNGSYKELKNKNLYYVEGEFNRVVLKQSYLKSIHNIYHIITLNDVIKRYRHEVRELFGYYDSEVVDSNGDITLFGETILNMQQEYLIALRNNVINYDDMIVPDSFIISRKVNRNSYNLKSIGNENITVRWVNGYSGGNKDTIKLSDLFNYKMPIFYGTQDDEHALSTAYRVYNTLFNRNSAVNGYAYGNFGTNNNSAYNYTKYKKGDNSIMFVQLSKSNVKYMKYCYNANYIKTFKYKMGYRKEELARNLSMSNVIKNKFEYVDKLFKHPDFSKINPKLGAIISEVIDYISAIDVPIDFNAYDSLIKNFYGINDITFTKEQLHIINNIDKIKEVNLKNRKILGYIDIPYDISRADDDFFDLLKKILTF